MAGRVIVVGSVNEDLVVSTERLPAPGETVIGGRFAQHHGGKGGNQAVAAARLGARTFFIGAVGDDAFGRAARAALEAEGVDVAGLFTLPDEATGVALIVVDEAGENSIAVASGANAALDSVQVRAALKKLDLKRADVVLVGHEIRTGATHEALRVARIAKATTILNPAPAHGLERPTLELADVLTPNEGELATLVGGRGRPSAQAKRLLGPEPGDRAVLVSLGANGTLLVDGKRSRAIAAHEGRRRRHGRGGRHAQRRPGRGTGGGPRPRRGVASGRDRRLARGHAARGARRDADRRRARSRPGLVRGPRGHSIAPAQIEKM